jgi:hypothetical protein
MCHVRQDLGETRRTCTDKIINMQKETGGCSKALIQKLTLPIAAALLQHGNHEERDSRSGA